MTFLRLSGFGGYLTEMTVKGIASKSLDLLFIFYFFLRVARLFWTLWTVFDSRQICLNTTNDYGPYPVTDLFGSKMWHFQSSNIYSFLKQISSTENKSQLLTGGECISICRCNCYTSRVRWLLSIVLSREHNRNLKTKAVIQLDCLIYFFLSFLPFHVVSKAAVLTSVLFTHASDQQLRPEVGSFLKFWHPEGPLHLCGDLTSRPRSACYILLMVSPEVIIHSHTCYQLLAYWLVRALQRRHGIQIWNTQQH